MTEREKAEAGLLYHANSDPEIVKGRIESQELSYDYNQCRPSQCEEREQMIRKYFAKTGQKFLIEQPFRCDFWNRVILEKTFIPIIIS